MSVEIKVPNVGESISEVVVSQWLVNDGDYVEKDSPVCELETDKINQELVAPESGVLHTSASEGDEVPIGAVIGSIEPGEKPNGADAGAKQEVKKEKHIPQPVDDETTEEHTRASSVARKVAAEHGVDLDKVEGTGAGGRITKDDVLAHLEANKQEGEKKETPPPPPRDSSRKEPEATKRSETGEPERRVTREKMSSLRKRVAQRLVEAQRTAAMLTTFNEADMSAVIDTRSKYKDSFQKRHGVKLGFMPFFLKAAVEALREFPRVNAFIENDEIVYHHYYDIGVAVGTDRGLVVPVLRNVEKLSFAEIEKGIRDYAERAQTGRLSIDDLTGGTFSITNGGVYGSMMSTPILNPPQSGILGMHNIVRRPVAIDDSIEIRPMMYLALSYDHRIVDGKEAVSFLVRIKQLIEAPERMLLEV